MGLFGSSPPDARPSALASDNDIALVSSELFVNLTEVERLIMSNVPFIFPALDASKFSIVTMMNTLPPTSLASPSRERLASGKPVAVFYANVVYMDPARASADPPNQPMQELKIAGRGFTKTAAAMKALLFETMRLTWKENERLKAQKQAASQDQPQSDEAAPVSAKEEPPAYEGGHDLGASADSKTGY